MPKKTRNKETHASRPSAPLPQDPVEALRAVCVIIEDYQRCNFMNPIDSALFSGLLRIVLVEGKDFQGYVRIVELTIQAVLAQQDCVLEIACPGMYVGMKLTTTLAVAAVYFID